MNGYKINYLHYKSTGKSEITTPRMLLEANNLNWKHKDKIFLAVKEFENQKGLFLSKKGEGHITSYLHYKKTKKSVVTIPRVVLETNNLNWEHKDEIFLTVSEINDQKGIFLYKKENK